MLDIVTEAVVHAPTVAPVKPPMLGLAQFVFGLYKSTAILADVIVGFAATGRSGLNWGRHRPESSGKTIADDVGVVAAQVVPEKAMSC